MYEYLDRFVRTWSDDDLIAVLSRLPEHEISGTSWAALIAAVGVKNFMRLTMTFPGKEIKIPTLFEVLSVVAAEEIVVKAETCSLADAKKQVLGELELKEVDVIVDRLQALAKPSEIVSAKDT